MEENELKSICDRLSDVGGSLKGVSGLFSQLSDHACLQKDELYGIGQLLCALAVEVGNVEDQLRGEFRGQSRNPDE